MMVGMFLQLKLIPVEMWKCCGYSLRTSLFLPVYFVYQAGIPFMEFLGRYYSKVCPPPQPLENNLFPSAGIPPAPTPAEGCGMWPAALQVDDV